MKAQPPTDERTRLYCPKHQTGGGPCYCERSLAGDAWLWILEERIQGWYVMSGQSRVTGSWSAWAKRTPLLVRDPLAEPGEVFFEHGGTRQEAIDRLVASDIATNVGLMGKDR